MSLSSGLNAAPVHENLTGVSSTTPTPKRRRLNLACNYCRSRKTRCDEQKPSCHACLAAGLACITTDPRRPDRHVERREAGKSSDTTLSIVPSLTPTFGTLQHQTANTASPESAPSTALSGTTSEQILPRREEERPRPTSDGNNNNNDGNNRNNTTTERFRGLLPILKHEVSSTSIDVLTGWLNVASFRLGLGHRFASRSSNEADQYHVPFPIQVPSLSNPSQHRTWASNYFQSVHPVYPVVDKEEVYSTLDALQTHGIRTLVPNPDCLPKVVAALVVLELGSSRPASGSSDTCEVYVFLKDLIGRLIGRPTFPNIKALFLLALEMYHHDDLAAAWSTLTLCVSMATAVGLGMSKTLFTASLSYEKEDERRTWMSIFVFEKLIAFEMGRRSSICFGGFPELERMVCPFRSAPQESFATAHVETSQPSGQEQLEDFFFKTVITLAKLLGEIGERCIGVRDREEVSEKGEIQRLITEKVKITGESCLQLEKWAENLPDNLRPGSDLIYDRRTFPYAAFLSIHYHNALLTLTRNSLLISESALRVTTEVISKDQPWGHVIRNGQPMVASTARKVIKLFIEAEESEIALLIPHTNASLHALYVLAVHLVRHPDNMLRKTDLDLIRQATYFAMKRINTRTNTLKDLSSILDGLDKALEQGVPSSLTSHRIGDAISSEQNQTDERDIDAPNQSHLSVSSDVSLYTLHNMTSSSDEGLSTQLPQLDDYSNDTLHYYGMDIGTWIGLDSIRWDQA